MAACNNNRNEGINVKLYKLWLNTYDFDFLEIFHKSIYNGFREYIWTNPVSFILIIQVLMFDC